MNTSVVHAARFRFVNVLEIRCDGTCHLLARARVSSQAKRRSYRRAQPLPRSRTAVRRKVSRRWKVAALQGHHSASDDEYASISGDGRDGGGACVRRRRRGQYPDGTSSNRRHAKLAGNADFPDLSSGAEPIRSPARAKCQRQLAGIGSAAPSGNGSYRPGTAAIRLLAEP